MGRPRTSVSSYGWRLWWRPIGLLLLILLGPFLLLPTRLGRLAEAWGILLLLAAWTFTMFSLVALMGQAARSPLTWLEVKIRAWVARFAPDPEALWLQWARQAHKPDLAYDYLERAVSLGGREALFQEGLVFLEGGFMEGGQVVALERFRKAAALGHPEAAFRLAEALRTGLGFVVPEASEAEIWYRRSAMKGFGPAAAWLARAYEDGDGVAVDEAKARQWAAVSERLKPHPPLSHNLFRHDAAPADVLVRWTGHLGIGLERGAERLVIHRVGRWLLGIVTFGMGAAWVFVVVTIFWAGSSGLYHLPLLMLGPPLLMLAWQAWKLRREGPRRRRDPQREAAERGDPEASYQMGLRFREGDHQHPKDPLEAVLWFRKAAEAGHTEAMQAMAEAYLGGHGVLRDRREAARWSEAAGRESTS